MAKRNGKKWNQRLNVERYEERITPDASFGWEVLPASAGVQQGLYFRIDGNPNDGQRIGDAVTISNNPVAGTINVSIATSSADDLTPLNYYLSITGGDIALAQNAIGATFRGFHVVTNDGNDVVGGLNLPWAMVVEAGAGSDTIDGGNVADKLDGGTGDLVNGSADVINGWGGSDLIIGGDGNDTIDGGSGADSISAGDGNDVVVGGTGNDTIDAGNGTNSVTDTSGNNLITTGTGADNITTGAGNDTINSGAGNDTINAGDGANSVDAGDGNDSVTTGTGNDTVVGGIGNDTVTSGAGNDSVNAGDGNDSVDAGAGNDTVLGGDGTDTITGGLGADSLDGGAGNNDVVNGDRDDVFLSGGAGTGDKLNLANVGTGIPLIDAQNDGFEDHSGIALDAVVIYAPSVAELTAIPQPNLSGFLNAGDTLSFQNSTTGLTINMSNLGFGLGSTVANVIGTGFNDFITGTAAANVIDGGAGNDVIDAGAGNDSVSGGTGNDVLMGGAGNDTLYGGAGNDVVSGGAGDDALWIDWNGGALNANDQFLGQDGFDTLVFVGVPDADGIPGNGIQPSQADLATIYAYIAAQNAAGKMDWNENDDPVIQFVPLV